MRIGAVAIVDALGFKGIWNHYDPAEIVSAIRRIQDTVASAATAKNQYAMSFRLFESRAAAFSDTMVFTAQPVTAEPGALGMAVAAVADLVSTLIHAASQGPVPLAYRGCIAAGKFFSTESLFIGEAVDEAAEWSERADAAVVWLTPSACRARREAEADPGFMRWNVPLKGTGEFATLTVNPFYALSMVSLSLPTLEELRKRILGTFDRSARIDVAQKRQRTEAFLAAAIRHSEATFPAHRAALVESFGEAEIAAWAAAGKRDGRP